MTLRRRSFLLGAGIAGAGAASGLGFWRWQELAPPRIHAPGRALGHRLRDVPSAQWPAPSADYRTDVVIVGSGVAGLTAAWRLAREGHTDFALVTGPEPHGNAAAGTVTVGDERLRYPTGAHYLPLPSIESVHVRTMLSDFGVLLAGPASATPTYDERVLVHSPDERLFRDGTWHESLRPGPAGEPALDRFLSQVDSLRQARGSDGRKVFAIPVAFASTDPAWTALDAMPWSAWLDREGHVDPALRWYLDYCCRDDYGADATRVSAWAGLAYFAARDGHADNAGPGAVLTWPDGLGALAARLDASAFTPRAGRPEAQRLDGMALSMTETRTGVDVLCARVSGDAFTTYRVRARRAISAMPLHVARHVVAPMADSGYDPARHAPTVAPWVVANFVLDRHPEEAPGAELAWDNVVYGSDGLGYVVSTHQEVRVAPSRATVFTAYRALADRAPHEARSWMDRASPSEIGTLAAAELRAVYGWRFAPCVTRVDVTLRGHAMATPSPGHLANAGLRALREADGRIVYAHADLSGYSVFEEAAWWGWRAAERMLG